MAKKKDKRKGKKKSRFTAKSADKHVLYQLSVQDAPVEIDFLDKTFKRIRGRKAKTFREDFCGTAWLSSEWVSRGEDRHATGLDLEPSVLEWATKNNLGKLETGADRVRLLQRDVLEGTKEQFDIVCAFNFSYFVFKTRELMRRYFESARRGVADDGVFFCDLYGGFEAWETMKEPRKIKGGFTYVWDQAEMNPIDNHVVNHIHFEFRDGTKMKRAFTYDWRLWTIPELRELLAEAGFSESHVYWEDEDEDGEGTGTFRRRTKVDNDAGWLAYIVALP